MNRLSLTAAAAAAALTGLTAGYILGRADQPVVELALRVSSTPPSPATPEQDADIDDAIMRWIHQHPLQASKAP